MKQFSLVEIGSLGLPLIFNNFITARSLADAPAVCSFSAPAICQDAGGDLNTGLMEGGLTWGALTEAQP